MLEDLRNKINKIYNSNTNSDELKSRIKKEIEIIGENNLAYLLKIRDILDKNYKHSYSISGSINSFYIAYYLDITCFNPVEYEIINDSKVSISINIRENEKDNLFNMIYKELRFIKKISNTSCDTNTDYSGFVFDENNELATYETGIVKAKKKDITHKYFIINIYEKEILSLLNKMYYGNDNVPNIFYEKDIINFKQNINKHSKYQSSFEQIISKVNKINKINIKELIKNNIYFNIKHIDQIILEYKLTFFKYHLPRTYYISYLEYLSNKASINIISKYQNNFSLFFKENKDELTLEYKFYSLWYDAKYMKDPLYDLDITTSNNKININYHNINHIYAESIDEKFSKINEIINKNSYKEIDIFGFEGNNEYYLSNLMAKQLNIHGFQVASYLNPLSGGKTFFDSDFYKGIDEDKYLKLINFYKTIPLFLHTEKYDDEEILDGILSCTDSGTQIIIIDNYEELLKLSKYTEKKILNILNKLNKEIFIFHKIKAEIILKGYAD